MKIIYYDPGTWECVPTPSDYQVEPYDRGSWLVRRVGSTSPDVVDLEGHEGHPHCTCADYLYRKGLDKPIGKWEYTTCKHIRLVRTLLRSLRT